MQVNIRLDEAVVGEIDGWAVVRGVSRPELVRHVLLGWLAHQRREQIEAQYRAAYADEPESEEDLARAEDAAQRLTAEEPWQPWW